MAAPPMFSRTGSEDFPVHLKCMITGPPKSGKTSLLGTVPNIVIADTEPHANNLQSVSHLDIPYKAIHGTDELRQLLFVLNDAGLRQQAAQGLGLPAIEAVAIDTLDTLQGIMKRERLKENRATQFLRDDWGWLKEEMTSMISAFLALPMHVFLVVHTKTKEVGSEKNPRTIYLPGLEGAIAESIAGMVGYSLLSFRKEELRSDGTKYTKYWLRAEGDETYEFLGNRAGGRLPDVIEPDFKTLLDAALAGRPTRQAPPVNVEIQTTGQSTPQPTHQAQQGATAAAVPADPQPTPAAPPTGQPANPPGDDEPINAAALSFVKKVYDALGQGFPEEKVKALNLGQARLIVRTYKAVRQDEAEGKMAEGQSASSVMMEFLTGQGWGPEAVVAAEPTPAPVEPRVDGTVEQVKAYVTLSGGDVDLARVQEAYDMENQRPTPRSSLTNWLVSQGAKDQTPVPTTTPEPAPEPQPQTVSPQPQAVTSSDVSADTPPTEDQAIDAVKEGLGGEVVTMGINPDALCEECGNTIDDVDLAQLGKGRFDRVLCVADYIAETKKPRG